MLFRVSMGDLPCLAFAALVVRLGVHMHFIFMFTCRWLGGCFLVFQGLPCVCEPVLGLWPFRNCFLQLGGQPMSKDRPSLVP